LRGWRHDRADARRRLGALWGDFMIDLPYLPASANRDLSLYNVPHFYTYRSDLLAAATWTYLYETHQLLQTLSDHVDFDSLNANKSAFVITAVDVENGKLVRFANQKVGKTEPTTIEAHHVLASGSIPQLRFGNRLRQDSSTARQMNELIATIQDLAERFSGPIPQDLQERVDKATAYKRVQLIDVSLTADAVSDDPNSFRDFSRAGILGRRDAGRQIALAALRDTFHSQLAA
jgi:hypothetical protein